MTLYQWDETDPVLKAWMSIFPGTVKPLSAIKGSLMEHLRYPEDLFKVQRYQYARYHVTDPSDFYQANNRWAVPEDPNSPGSSQTPVRMYTRNPVTGVPMWSLTSNYVPRSKTNLVGFVAVDSDATSTDYGRVRSPAPCSPTRGSPARPSRSGSATPPPATETC